ncbi:MAG: RsmE family RNA methyltransferase [Sulfuricurvum sp.]|nr:RsmE family RNA methyltransferase [Sulfuricurvum sp.]MDD5385887.1 RsmE family RNA methyltransferase [Sulfuricurvum sp.]
MKFILHAQAGSQELVVSGEEYKYLIKVRRHVLGDLIVFRHRDTLSVAHHYRLEKTDGRNGYFVRESSLNSPCETLKKLHIGWCIIDPKTIEKTLPMLMELGISKITFIHCKRSQRNFRLDFERFNRIMESAMMQCGRTSYIELSETPALSTFLNANPETVVLDFGGEVLGKNEKFETVVIGCEGGFDDNERKLCSSHRIRHFNLPMVLRSETAAVAIASMRL